MFKVIKGKEKEFKEKFEAYFGEYFYLFSKEEVIEKKFFGEVKYKENELFRSSLGDFFAINKNNNNKAFFGQNDYPFISAHGGNSEDEVYIPLIVLNK